MVDALLLVKFSQILIAILLLLIVLLVEILFEMTQAFIKKLVIMEILLVLKDVQLIARQ